MVANGDFRADLYYRLNVITIEVPPLRLRPDDIELLAEFFLNKQAMFYNEPAKHLNADARKLILQYPWPGNIRELANIIERAYVLSPSNEILASAMPMEILLSGAKKGNSVIPTIEQAKRQLGIQALEYTKCQKEAAAQLLGIERRALNRMIKKFDISLNQIKHSTSKN
jgi:DNA-binding NtrC family response regulator